MLDCLIMKCFCLSFPFPLMFRLLRRVCLLGILLFPITLTVQANAKINEEALKAAFLHNFINFVTWPKTKGDKLVYLCVLGDNPFNRTLETLGKETKKLGRKTHR